MSMLPEGIIPIETGKDGRVLDFVCESGAFLITDYHHLDEKIIAEDNVVVKTAGKQERLEITSIEKLKLALEEFVTASIEILQHHTPYVSSNPYTKPDFSTIKKKLLIEQLVFDILFDKYMEESPLMTRNEYSDYMSKKIYSDKIQRMACARAINENIRRGMESDYNMMKYSSLRNQLKLLGVNPIKYDEYYNPELRGNSKKKKPKYTWDYFFYNFGRNPKEAVSDDKSEIQTKYGRSLITSRQYRRKLTRDGRNYPFEEIFQDLKVYHDFVSKLLPVENESYEKYFRMSMDYYVLESYKRVDFMFRLMDVLSSDEIVAIDRKHFIVERFVPLVLAPLIQNGKLRFASKKKYYKPLFIVEETLLTEILAKRELLNGAFPQETQEVNSHCAKYYESQLKKYQYVRAKAYELFKYHCTFSSDNYIEIKDFLRRCYDMRAYHQSNTFWSLIQDTNWKDMDEKTRNQVKKRIQYFLSLNDAFFWESDDRNYTKPKNE